MYGDTYEYGSPKVPPAPRTEAPEWTRTPVARAGVLRPAGSFGLGPSDGLVNVARLLAAVLLLGGPGTSHCRMRKAPTRIRSMTATGSTVFHWQERQIGRASCRERG